MKIDCIEVGLRIRNIRNNKNMTQETLAEKSDLSLTHISNLENARTNMSVDSLVSICNALEISSDELLFGHPLYGEQRYYSDFVNLLLDCNELEKEIIINTASCLKAQLKKRK